MGIENGTCTVMRLVANMKGGTPLLAFNWSMLYACYPKTVYIAILHTPKRKKPSRPGIIINTFTSSTLSTLNSQLPSQMRSPNNHTRSHLDPDFKHKNRSLEREAQQPKRGLSGER